MASRFLQNFRLEERNVSRKRQKFRSADRESLSFSADSPLFEADFLSSFAENPV
jgi:hypothetical protein